MTTPNELSYSPLFEVEWRLPFLDKHFDFSRVVLDEKGKLKGTSFEVS